MYHSFFPWIFIFLGMLALIPWLYGRGNKRKPRRDF